MTVTFPDSVKDFLERPLVVSLVTLMEDGQPQVSPVWFSYDGSHILVNSALGRQKDENMRERPRVSVLFLDSDNPYRYLEVRGEVDEITQEGALDHINQLAKKYVGRDDYYDGDLERQKNETRVMYKIKPVHIVPRG